MAQYALMADVFIANAAEHPVFFSLCGWASWYAASGPAQGVGDSYRVGTDCVGFEQMLLNIDALAPYARLLGNGRYPDLDMVSAAATRALSGNLPPGGRGPGSLLAARVQTHFSMIAVTGSMLLLSFDVRDARNQHLIDVVGNRRIISVHQDPTRTFVDRGVGYMRRLSGTAMAASAKRLRSNSHCSTKEARWVFHRNGSDTVGAFESVARPGWCIQTNSGNAPGPSAVAGGADAVRRHRARGDLRPHRTVADRKRRRGQFGVRHRGSDGVGRHGNAVCFSHPRRRQCRWRALDRAAVRLERP